MHTALVLVTPPTADPVTVADLKIHARVDNALEDSELAGYISAATQLVETDVGRALMPQQWRYSLEHWPGRGPASPGRNPSNLAQVQRYTYIEIPKPPLVSIDTFTYLDTAGNSTNMQQGFPAVQGNYLLDLDSAPGRVSLPYSCGWPSTTLLPSLPIAIKFTCGYAKQTGTCTVDASGLMTWVSGNKFTPALQGTWITIAGTSYNALTVTDDSHIQLVAPPVAAITQPAVFASSEVPMAIRQAIAMMCAHLYENREAVNIARSAQAAIEVPYGIARLVDRYRVWHTSPE